MGVVLHCLIACFAGNPKEKKFVWTEQSAEMGQEVELLLSFKEEL